MTFARCFNQACAQVWEDLLVFDRLKTHVEIQPEPADGRVGGAEVVGAGYRQPRRRGAQHQVGAVLAAPAATL